MGVKSPSVRDVDGETVLERNQRRIAFAEFLSMAVKEFDEMALLTAEEGEALKEKKEGGDEIGIVEGCSEKVAASSWISGTLDPVVSGPKKSPQKTPPKTPARQDNTVTPSLSVSYGPDGVEVGCVRPKVKFKVINPSIEVALSSYRDEKLENMLSDRQL